MIRSFLCPIAEPIVRSIVAPGCGIDEVVPPTEVPGTLDFALTELPAAIQVDIGDPKTGGRAGGYRFKIRRENDAKTGFETAQDWVDIGTRRRFIIRDYSDTQAIEVGRKYQVKVIAYNVVGDGVESAYMEVIPLTNIPAVPSFKLDAHDATIRLILTKVDDPLNELNFPTYQYFIQERNAADTDWVDPDDSFYSISDDPFGHLGAYTFISETDTQIIIDVISFQLSGQSPHSLINDRDYRIRVRSGNSVEDSAWSAYMTDTPMAGAVPTQLPGIPTFAFAPLRYAIDNSQVRTTVNFVPTPNSDGIGVTHWLFRYRRVGTTTWETQTVVAQPELDTAYGFILNQSELEQNYEVQVASRNSDGDSAYTSSQTIVITRPLPQVPVWAFVYNPFIFDDALTFSVEPTDQISPVLPITGYSWRYRVSGATSWDATEESGIASFYQSTLPNSYIGRLLEVQMRSKNAVGNGNWSASQTLQIIDVPDRPEMFLTAQINGFDIRPVRLPTGYMATGGGFRYREGTSGDWTDGMGLEVRGLNGGTLYQVEGWNSNPAGRSLSVFGTVTTLVRPLVLPLVPTFTVSIPSIFNPFDYDVAPIQNAAEPTTITYWNIRYREDGTQSWTDERVINVSGATYGNTLDRLTVRGKTYEFQVAAENSDGVGPYAASQTITFLGVPDRPQLFLTAQPAGFDVRLVHSPSGSQSTSFVIRYREGTSGDWTITNSANIRNLKPETLYQVEGWGTNLAGRSLSVLATITTLAVPLTAGKAFMFSESVFTGEFERVGLANAFGLAERGNGLTSIGNQLYMIGFSNNALYLLDKDTGVATRIGSANRFGVNENGDALTAIGNQLYMIGNSNHALYLLDKDTGVATRIGSANRFGVNENGDALTAIGNQLYMIGRVNRALYLLDKDTGVATRIGSAVEFGVGEMIVEGLTSIGNQLYMVGFSNNALYLLDKDTGVATRIGSAVEFGVSESGSALTAIGNQLYMIGTGIDALYRSLMSVTPKFYSIGEKVFMIGE